MTHGQMRNTRIRSVLGLWGDRAHNNVNELRFAAFDNSRCAKSIHNSRHVTDYIPWDRKLKVARWCFLG